MAEVDTRASDEGSCVKTRSKTPHGGIKLSEHAPVTSPGGEKIRCRPQQKPDSPSRDLFHGLDGK